MRFGKKKKKKEQRKIHDRNEELERKKRMQDSLRSKGKGIRRWRKRDRKSTERDIWKMRRRGSRVHTEKSTRDSRESVVLSRSPLQGTSTRNETRMHVSVQRSVSSRKRGNEAKMKRKK